MDILEVILWYLLLWSFIRFYPQTCSRQSLCLEVFVSVCVSWLRFSIFLLATIFIKADLMENTRINWGVSICMCSCNVLWRKISFSSGHHCQSQGMKQTNRHICGVLYFKINGLGAIYKVIKGSSWSWSYVPSYVPITTKVMSWNPVHGEVHSIQHYVIKFDLRRSVVFYVFWWRKSKWGVRILIS